MLCKGGEKLQSVFSKEGSSTFYVAYFVIMALTVVTFELIYRAMLSCFHRLPLQPQLVGYDFVENEIARGRKLMVYEDSVIDVEAYVDNHPGIDGLLNAYIGKEIGRYMHGGFPCGTFKSHDHSYESLELIKRLKIATLSNTSKDHIFLPLIAGRGDHMDSYWTLIGKKRINNAITLFRFKCPDYRSSSMLPGVSHCGKYFTVINIT